MNTTTNQTTWQPVTKTTRASQHGTQIRCTCGHVERVYHFAWVALSCLQCDQMTEKYEWQVAGQAKKAN